MAPVRAFPIIVPPNLHVGYVAADVDLVPESSDAPGNSGGNAGRGGVDVRRSEKV